MLSCHRRNDVQKVQQDNADKDVSNTCLIHRSASDKDCRGGKETGLIMRVIGAHVSHILQEDNLPDTGEYRRNNNRNNPCPLNRNTGGERNRLILTDCPHILSELCLSKPHDKKTQRNDNQIRKNRNFKPCNRQRNGRIEHLPDGRQLKRITHPVAAGKHNRLIVHRNNRPEDVQHKELINSVKEKTEDVARNHFPPAGAIQHRTGNNPEQDGKRHTDTGCKHQPVDTADAPVHRKNQTDLPCHCTEHHPEVNPHSGHNRQDECKHQKGVSADPR